MYGGVSSEGDGVRAGGSPGDEEGGVVVGRVAVVRNILGLLPHAEVVEGLGGVEVHRWALLRWREKKRKMTSLGT